MLGRCFLLHLPSRPHFVVQNRETLVVLVSFQTLRATSIDIYVYTYRKKQKKKKMHRNEGKRAWKPPSRYPRRLFYKCCGKMCFHVSRSWDLSNFRRDLSRSQILRSSQPIVATPRVFFKYLSQPTYCIHNALLCWIIIIIVFFCCFFFYSSRVKEHHASPRNGVGVALGRAKALPYYFARAFVLYKGKHEKGCRWATLSSRSILVYALSELSDSHQWRVYIKYIKNIVASFPHDVYISFFIYILWAGSSEDIIIIKKKKSRILTLYRNFVSPFFLRKILGDEAKGKHEESPTRLDLYQVVQPSFLYYLLYPPDR